MPEQICLHESRLDFADDGKVVHHRLGQLDIEDTQCEPRVFHGVLDHLVEPPESEHVFLGADAKGLREAVPSLILLMELEEKPLQDFEVEEADRVLGDIHEVTKVMGFGDDVHQLRDLLAFSGLEALIVKLVLRGFHCALTATEQRLEQVNRCLMFPPAFLLHIYRRVLGFR